VTLCPVCGEKVTAFNVGTFRTVIIRGIIYHIGCVKNVPIAEVVDKWKPIKSP